MKIWIKAVGVTLESLVAVHQVVDQKGECPPDFRGKLVVPNSKFFKITSAKLDPTYRTYTIAFEVDLALLCRTNWKSGSIGLESFDSWVSPKAEDLVDFFRALQSRELHFLEFGNNGEFPVDADSAKKMKDHKNWQELGKLMDEGFEIIQTECDFPLKKDLCAKNSFMIIQAGKRIKDFEGIFCPVYTRPRGFDWELSGHEERVVSILERLKEIERRASKLKEEMSS